MIQDGRTIIGVNQIKPDNKEDITPISDEAVNNLNTEIIVEIINYMGNKKTNDGLSKEHRQ